MFNAQHSLLRLGAILLSSAAGLLAADAAQAVPDRAGYVGQRSLLITGSAFHMEGVAPLKSSAAGWTALANVPVLEALDVGLEYESNRAGSWIGLTQLQRTADVRLTLHGCGADFRPFVTALVGRRTWEVEGWHRWTKHSATYAGQAGVEFQMARSFVLTPAIEYFKSPKLDDDAGWTGQVKAEWRFAPRWSLVGSFKRIEWCDDTAASVFTCGIGFIF